MLKFIKNWTLPLAMLVGTLAYLVDAAPEVKNTFTIGATANRGGGYAFQGLVKNMKLYEKALLPEEVIELK